VQTKTERNREREREREREITTLGEDSLHLPLPARIGALARVHGAQLDVISTKTHGRANYFSPDRISVHVRRVHDLITSRSASSLSKIVGGRGARAIQTILNLPQRPSARDLHEADSQTFEERVAHPQARNNRGTITPHSSRPTESLRT